MLSPSSPDFIPSALDGIVAIAEEGRQHKEYLDHWESTVQTTDTGRLVDAIILPVAP